METKTLNEWMKKMGWHWNPGQEQVFKAELTRGEAESLLSDLHYQGAVSRG